MVLVTKKILYYKNSVVLTVLHLLVSRNLIDVRFIYFPRHSVCINGSYKLNLISTLTAYTTGFTKLFSPGVYFCLCILCCLGIVLFQMQRYLFYVKPNMGMVRHSVVELFVEYNKCFLSCPMKLSKLS